MRFLLPLQIKMYHVFWLKRRKKKCTKMLATGVLDESVSYCQKDLCCLSFLDSRTSLNKSRTKPGRPSDNSNPGWDTGDLILGEFPCLTRYFSVLSLGSVWSCGLETKEIFRLLWAFWGTQNVIAGNEKPVLIHLYLHWFSTNGVFAELNIWCLHFRVSFPFSFVLVRYLHKIQRVLKKITVCT